MASVKPIPMKHAMPRVMLAQHDMYSHVLQGLQDAPHIGWVLICYLKSLTEHSIPAGKLLISNKNITYFAHISKKQIASLAARTPEPLCVRLITTLILILRGFGDF